jgi:hypothetical protein
MDQTAPVTNVGTFTADDTVATIVLKMGNGGGSTNGLLFDNLVVTESTPLVPTISLSTSTLTPSMTEGVNPSPQTFTVSNTGDGTLNYTVSDNQSWLSVSPTSGASTGEADTITVTYSAASLSAGTYYATITVDDTAASNGPQTISVTLTVNAAPAMIGLSTNSLTPSCDEGEDATSGSFTVQNDGGGTLSYSISDNVTWLSVSPTSGTSTGEADTITVTYDTDALTAGTHNATISISDSGATNSPQSVSVTLTVNSVAATTIAEDFNSMPSWSSSFDASWGSNANWSIDSNGHSGSCLKATRNSGGSSVKAKVYTIDANTSYTISVYMDCGSSSNSYWYECAYKLGSNSAQDFDQNAGTWTMIQKFSNTGTNGNGGVFTQYSKTFNSGSNTQITVGYKAGSGSGSVPTIKWDTLRIE